MPEQRENCVRDGGLPTIPAPAPAGLTDTLPDAGSRFTSATCDAALPSGSLLGEKFRIDRLLGYGSMGQVYLARDEALDLDVAIKLVIGPTQTTPEWRSKVMNEARTMARIRHENVVALYGVGEYGNKLYLVMEHVPGVDLYAWLLDRGPLPLSEAHAVIAQLSRGLQAIHDGGAVHRDVKPSNVLVGASFRVVLTDFGLARWIDQTSISGEHGVVGTPAYMAPEMIIGPRPPSDLVNRVDVYSLGVLAFELIAGRLPFDSMTPARVILDHIATPAPPLSRFRPDVPASVGEAIAAAMDKNPNARPASAMEFLMWLEQDLFVPRGARQWAR